MRKLGLLLLALVSVPAIGRTLTATDCSFLVSNESYEIANPYGDGGTLVVYRNQLEAEVEAKLPMLRENRREILGFFDMMNFVESFQNATRAVRERALLDMTGAYYLVGYSDTDGFSFAMNIRIVKDIFDIVYAEQNQIPDQIRASVIDSVLVGARPELRKHSHNYTWTTFVQFPVAQLTGKRPGGGDISPENFQPTRTFLDLVNSESFGHYDTVAFQVAFATAVRRKDPRWKEVGWVLVASANAAPKELRSAILEAAIAYLDDRMGAAEWQRFMTMCNERFVGMRIHPR